LADAQVVYKQALQLGLADAQWIASQAVYSDSILAVPETAKFMASSVIGTRPTNPEGSAAYDAFAAAYEAAFNSSPGIDSSNSYDATNLSFTAMKNVGTSDTTKIAAEVLRIAHDYTGASGSITLTPTGDRISCSYEVWKVVKNVSSYSYVTVKVFSQF
jgi:ABC-type branched-subunit amino acid transport system substrate-binding protein